MLEGLGIKMIYKAKLMDNDDDKLRKSKELNKKVGISFIIIGSVLTIFIIVMELL